MTKSSHLFKNLINNRRSYSTSSTKYDLAVIGAGPGGYTTAIKAAQLGLKVACIERRGTLGGTCLNCGCIPSKSLLHSSHHVHVQSNSSSTRRGASSNYLSLKSNATPRDRGRIIVIGPQVEVEPESDLRELEGEVNREATTASGKTSGGEAPSMAMIVGLEFMQNQSSMSNTLLILVNAGLPGFKTTGFSYDLKSMMDQKESVLKTLNAGINGLFRKNKVDYIKGHGKLLSSTEIKVGDDVFSAKNIILATGSESTPFPHESLKVDGKCILSSTEMLCLDRIPKDLIVIGGGAIGLELASVWKCLGSNVTILEYNDRLCSVMDKDVSLLIRKILEKKGMIIKTGTSVIEAEKKGDLVYVKTSTGEYVGDTVLIAMGRRPYLDELGINELGIKTDRGKVIVDDQFRVTGYDNIRAIGDLIHGPMLAHKAEMDGMAALGFITGQQLTKLNYNTIPSIIYTTPEIAGVGTTENQLIDSGVNYKKSIFPFGANSRARIYSETDGFVKILATNDNVIVGAWIIGPCASELIQQFTLPINLKLTSKDVTDNCFAHPTLSETIKEACMGIHSKPIHSH